MNDQKLLTYEPTVRKAKKQCIKYPGCVTIQYEKMGRKVVGVINRTESSMTDESYPYKYYADVYLDNVHMFAIEECVCGRDKLVAILRGALWALAMRATRGMRMRQNRKAKKGGEV